MQVDWNKVKDDAIKKVDTVSMHLSLNWSVSSFFQGKIANENMHSSLFFIYGVGR